MATYGVIGSPTYAVAINDLGNMLVVLPDNSSNLITAQDVRDVVAGLYENIEGVSSSLVSIATSSLAYTNFNLTSVDVGGIPYNSFFTGSSIQSVLDRLFYPYTSPVLNLTVSQSLLEYGDTTQVSLDWSVQAGINDIQSSNLLRPLQSPQILASPLAFGLTSGTLASNTPIINNVTVFTFSVNDLNNLVFPVTGGDNFATASLQWSLRRYWGTLSTGDALLSVSNLNFSYLDVSFLSSDLNEIYSQSREIMTNSDYVVFIWPNNSINLQSSPPKVFINGLPNNDWTKTRDGVVFTNQFGYTASYDVWKFNNIQGSFTSSYVITT
jgi:hypothetical protein